MKKIAVHLAEGFEEIEAITIIDVLRRADFQVFTVSISTQKEVKGSHQITLIADQLFEDINYSTIDMIILPGGMPGSRNLNNHEALKKQIEQFYQQGKLLGAICAAPLVFGDMGILKNQDAVCYPGFENELLGANVKTEPVVVSGNIITGRGVGTALKFALKIVEQLDSKEKAKKLANAMLVDF